jgi:D-serine deaminase-like pyridoxal phosphate-dependent protein
MKKISRRWIIITIIIIAIISLLIAVKPGDRGGAYHPYFAALNAELRAKGPGRPVIIVDLDRLDKNIEILRKNLKSPMKFRLVVKSIPSIWLMRYILDRMGSNRVMVFHGPDLTYLAGQGAKNLDILLGKPMPVNAVKEFYRTLRPGGGFDPAKQVQWLVDTPERLRQYLEFAKERGIKMKINMEIDVGLHRGGLRSLDELDAVLSLMAANPAHLLFSGFMGYDVHAASAPSVIGSKMNAVKNAFDRVMTTYRGFYEHGMKQYPALFPGELTFNSGGSHTFMLFDGSGPVNDIALGSVLVKPSDFDRPLLENHEEALFVAVPVLKRLEGILIPFLDGLSGLMSWWNPNRQVTYFIYGGGWRAAYLSPAGLIGNTIYGFSTNQGIVNGSAATGLSVDDHIFLRPSQSEAIMREFGDIIMMRGGKIAVVHPPFPQ